jgi:S-adenosylmethionine synthetase
VDVIVEKIREVFDLTPNGIARTLNLRQFLYLKTASYGHFGRIEFPWEIIDPKIIQLLTFTN